MRHLTTIAAAAALLCLGTASARAQQGTSAPREMATPNQEKPAHQPQQTVPGPTPQETSKPTDSGHSAAADRPRLGTSAPEKPTGSKAEGAKSE
jgi:hypothetical protein